MNETESDFSEISGWGIVEALDYTLRETELMKPRKSIAFSVLIDLSNDFTDE